jgi:galactose mutarotase-like enzyme
MSLQSQLKTDAKSDQIILSNDRAQVEVFTSGASTHNYAFKTGDGGVFKPFAEAQWLDEHRELVRPDIPRHLQLIGGEFACVPFGTTNLDAAHHGYCSNHIWRVDDRTGNFVALSIEYPSDHAVHNVIRTIELEEATGALKFSLEVNVRQKCTLPIGVHPIFKLPGENTELRIAPPQFEHGSSAPKSLLGEAASLLAPSTDIDQNSSIWDSANTLKNELIQLWNTTGKFCLEYPADQFAVDLSWNCEELPHCLIWIANPGLNNLPFGDGFVAIGIEPTNSFFDANDEASRHGCLYNIANINFGVDLEPDEAWSTQYKIACRDMKNKHWERPNEAF